MTYKPTTTPDLGTIGGYVESFFEYLTHESNLLVWQELRKDIQCEPVDENTDTRTRQRAVQRNKSLTDYLDLVSLDGDKMYAIKSKIDNFKKKYASEKSFDVWNKNRVFAYDLCTDM